MKTQTILKRTGLALLLAAAGIGTWLLAAPDADKKNDKAPAGEQAGPGGPGGAPTMPPPQASFTVVQPRTLPIMQEYVGTTEAFRRVEVNARTKGYIEKRNFEEGQQVKAGQLLYVIDPRTYQADLDIVKAQLEQAEARRELADRDYKRLAPLRETGAISSSDLDKAEAQVTEARAAVNLAKAQLKKSQLELSFTRVEAPITGLIGKPQRDLGGYVDDFQNSLMTEVWQVDPIYVTFRVSEREYLEQQREIAAGRIVQASPDEKPYVEVVLSDNRVQRLRGTITYQDPKADPGTGTILFRAELENPDYKLRPGQYVKARVKGWQRPNVIAVPQRAVHQSPQGAAVMVLAENNIVQPRPVKLGAWTGQEWIIEDGLKPGERAVVEGMVMPGMPANPVPYVAKTETTNTVQVAETTPPPATAGSEHAAP